MATARAQPKIVKLLDYAGNELGVCTLLVLALVMLADEEEAPQERTLLNRIAESSGLEDIVIEDVILLAHERDVGSIELACDALREILDNESQRRFLELCVSMGIADGYIAIPEQHVLRFLADLFEVGPEEFQDLYRSVAGTDLPSMGDPSSPEWWAQQTSGKDGGRKSQESNTRQRSDRWGSSGEKQTMSEKDRRAYAILGLDPGASQSEIKEAYRMLAKVHHPDRFEQVGEEATSAANERFRQINEAYNHLT